MEKISPQQALANYMWTKLSLLPYRKRKYMTKKIEKDVLTWSKEESIKILKEILKELLICKEAIRKKRTTYSYIFFLMGKLCPYCYKNKRPPVKTPECNKCFYGKTRGICRYPNSVWKSYYSFPFNCYDQIEEKSIDNLLSIIQKGL